MKRSGLILAISFLAASAQAAPTLTGGTANGAPGYTINLPISFNPSPSTVVGVNFRLTLPNGMSAAGMPIAGSTLGASTGNKVVVSSYSPVCDNTIYTPTGPCTPPPPNTWNFVVVGLFDPNPATGACSGTVRCGNTNAIASGKLMDVPIRIAAGTAVNAYPIQISNITYVDAAGNAVAGGTPVAGTVNVGQFSPCDVTQNGSIGATDIQQEINWILGQNCPLPRGDIDGNGTCGSTDLQKIINAPLSGGLCVSP
jgi:hypothetical protein